MGNLEYVSFKRDVSDDEFEETLSSVAEELFDDRVYVEKHDDWSEWTVLVREDLVEDTPYHPICFNIGRLGPRKFGGKMGRNIGSWLRILLVETAADRIGHATMSNEGGEGTWPAEPLKCKTYESYLREIRHNYRLKDSASSFREKMIEEEMKFVPEELLKSNAAE